MDARDECSSPSCDIAGYFYGNFGDRGRHERGALEAGDQASGAGECAWWGRGADCGRLAGTAGTFDVVFELKCGSVCGGDSSWTA